MFLVLLALGAAVASAVGYVRSRVKGEKGAFDVHLPPSFEDSIMRALKTEKDALKVQTYGEALLEDYPIAAGVMLTRARNLANPTTTGTLRLVRNRVAPEGLHRTREEANEAQRVVAAIAADDRLARLSPVSIARRLRVRLPVVQAVLASSDSAGHGLITDPHILVSHVGEPSPPVGVDRKTVELAIAAAKGKPSAKRILNHLRMQNPDGTRAAERIVAQALWAKTYSAKKSG